MQILALGKPAILTDQGDELSVRGHQAWAVLARLLLDQRPVSRRRLASEIFPEAEDPLGALRWSLAALRRCIGKETLTGDPVETNLPTDVYVDLWEMDSDDFDLDRAGELLEGIDPASSAAFSTWLLIERERLANRVRANARRRAINAMSARNFDEAVRLANVCIRTDPFDEGGHILLVKALALAGRTQTADAHVRATEADFVRELGQKPTDALRSAARHSIAAPPVGVSASAVAETQIAAGKAALDAGALDAGLDCLRRAAASAEEMGDGYLQARALLELGTALVHTASGYDDEGAVILRQAVETARDCSAEDVTASALRELGYVDALAGRRPWAHATLEEARHFADGDDEALAGVCAVAGFNLVDWGRYEAGLEQFEQAIEHARLAGNARKEAWALGIGGWGQIKSRRIDAARNWLRRAAEVCDRTRWVAFNPWVRSASLEAELAARSNSATRDDLESVFAMSCQIGDPCWEGASARVLALGLDAAGQPDQAMQWLTEAGHRCSRVTDTWAGLKVAILADRARIARRDGSSDQAQPLTRELLEAAARTHADGYLKEAMGWLN